MRNEIDIEARLARVERLLEAIAELEYVRDGQILQAVAAYRNEMGVGLREAKDAVDEIRRRMQSR